jgi:hypothetical protein
MTKRIGYCFTDIEHFMWRLGVAHWIETVAKSLANELRSVGATEPLHFYCHPMKVEGFEGGTIYCEENDNDGIS